MPNVTISNNLTSAAQMGEAETIRKLFYIRNMASNFLESMILTPKK